jgi:serine protease inhibitor
MKSEKIFKLFLFAGLIALTSSGCSTVGGLVSGDEPLSEDVKNITYPANEFGVNLFKELIDESPEENIFISPVSISIALSMLYNGSEGESKAEMAEVLKLQDLDMQELNNSSKSFISLMNNKKNAEVNIANSLWSRDSFGLSQDFRQTLQDFYFAEAGSLDFSKESSAEKINDWVKDKTKGKIDKIIDKRVSESTVLFLINAIYFKGQWEDEFDKDSTEKDEFKGVNLSEQVDFMQRFGDYKYLERGGDKVIKIPYRDRDMYMLVVLPERSPSDFLKDKTFEDIGLLAGETIEREGRIKLPRFTVEYDKTLNDTLKAMGIESIFVPGNDLDSIMDNPEATAENLFISQVKHKSFIEVNEKGTEAAAVTSIQGELTSASPDTEPFSMIVDRPFLYMIMDESTESALFMGVVNQLED